MRFLLVLGVVVAIAAPARAEDDGEGGRGAEKGALGVGIILGEPTGLTAKWYFDDSHAVQGAVGSALIGGGLQLHADYLFHPYVAQVRESFVLPLYIGPGVRLIDYTNGRDESSLAIGARVVGGLLFDFTHVPLDAFLEIAGVLEYEFKDGEGGAIRLNAGAGVRYYF
jgi:hypothetical protein